MLFKTIVDILANKLVSPRARLGELEAFFGEPRNLPSGSVLKLR